MKYCINTSMLPPSQNIFEKIKTASNAGFHGIEPWLTEIENQNPKDIINCCRDYGIIIPTIEQIRGWFENDGELMGVNDDHLQIMNECKRRMELAAAIEAEWIIATPAFSHRKHYGSWEQGVDYFRELIEIGKKIGCKPTIEFMGQTAQINNFNLCEKFIEDVGAGATMVIDAYHLWRGGGTVYDFERFTPEKISVLHISDADKTIQRIHHMDRNRVMPLDGQIDLIGFAKTAEKINYYGFVNIGVYNKLLWEMQPQTVAEDSIKRLNTLFVQQN